MRIFCVGMVGLAILLAGCTTASGGAAPAPSSTPQVLLDQKGTGTQIGPRFTVGGDWALDWSYDCSPPGTLGTFAVTLYEADGDVVKVLVNEKGSGGEDLIREREQDSFYLGVTSTCSWHVVVRG